MADASGTPLSKKLGIHENGRVVLLAAPTNLEALLAPLPKNVTLRRRPPGPGRYDVVMLFVTSQKALQKSLKRAAAKMRADGGLWICWPKKSSGVETDLSDDAVRRAGLRDGMVGNKLCAIDSMWSGLRLVNRTCEQPKRP